VGPALTLAQQAQALLIAGLTVTCTSGGWSGTFSVLMDTSGKSIPTLVMGELNALVLSGNAAFAVGSTTVQWPDMSGALRAMTPVQSQGFAKAIGAFTGGCRNFANGVANAALPPASATIP
jgi:hypothetical protein